MHLLFFQKPAILSNKKNIFIFYIVLFLQTNSFFCPSFPVLSFPLLQDILKAIKVFGEVFR